MEKKLKRSVRLFYVWCRNDNLPTAAFFEVGSPLEVTVNAFACIISPSLPDFGICTIMFK